MSKSIVVPSSPPTLYEHAPNQWRPWEPPSSGSLPLYTLKTPTSGQLGGGLTYLGSFIPSDGSTAGDSFMAYTEIQALFQGSQAGRLMMTGIYADAICEVQIPTLVVGTNINALNVATMTQQFKYATPMRTQFYDPRILGGYVHEGQVIIGGVSWYDNSGLPQNYMVYRNAANLASSAQAGMFRVTGGRHNAGWTVPIPTEFQSAFGATHLQGHGGNVSILFTTTAGISIYAVNADDIIAATTQNQIVSATPLVDYDVGNPMGGEWNSSPMWNALSVCGGFFFVPGTRTLMAVGQNWLSKDYDPRPQNQILYKSPGVVDENGDDFYGGYFSYYVNNYTNFYWLFNIDDLIAVKNGQKGTQEVLPYEWGTLPLYPFFSTLYGGSLFGGATYDTANNILYVSSQRGATDRFGSVPTIAAFQLNNI